MAAPDAAFLVALDGAIVGWGAGASTLFGHAPDELIGQPVSVLVPPEEPSAFPRILAAVARRSDGGASHPELYGDGMTARRIAEILSAGIQEQQ